MGRSHRYTDIRRVAVEPATAWEVVSDHERMSEWTPSRAVVLETPGSPDRNGVGAVRALHMFGPTVRERITAFEPPTTLRYELVSGLPFRDYTGQITVEPSGNGSVISTAISFRTIIPGTQILVAIAIRVASAGAARAALRRSR
jgi:hypothetical protein